jgi:DNA-binding LacI/PurR family transcriptional regulator
MVSFQKNSKDESFKKTTITEIAKIAGVSKTTVSRVLSGGSNVSKKTKDKVLKVIEQNNYKPSIIAQSLRTNKTKTIGLVIADIENPFYARVAKGVIDTAEIKNYNVILCNSNNDINSEEKEIDTLINRGVDGLLLTTVALKTRTIKNLLDKQFPFMLIDCKLDYPGINYVVNDDYYGAKLATEYLINLGHKNIFFLGNKKLLSLRERLKGFKDALKLNKYSENTSTFDELVDINNMHTLEKIIKYIINHKNKITAIFAGNDYWAIKTIKIINDYGLNVPEDISVIGYDNIEISAIIKPPLTTIRQPKYLLGKLAAEQLLEIIENGSKKEIKRIVLKPDLIIRNSCKKL